MTITKTLVLLRSDKVIGIAIAMVLILSTLHKNVWYGDHKDIDAVETR